MFAKISSYSAYFPRVVALSGDVFANNTVRLVCFSMCIEDTRNNDLAFLCT